MIPEGDIKRMEQGKQQIKDSLQNIPAEVSSCLESSIGAEAVAKFKSGEAMPPKNLGDKMRECFEKYRPQGPEGNAPGNMAPGTTGPGGCTSPEECQKYCESNPGQCNNSQQPARPMPSGGPGFGPMPCEGTNCPPPSSGGESGPMMQPCEGENCPPQLPQGPSGDGIMPPQGQIQPSPATGPGTGGEMLPGQTVPLAPPSESVPQAPPPSEAPPSPPSSYNFRNVLGTILNSFGEYLLGK